MLLKDKVAIITGAGTGIGRGIAIAMAAEGTNTILAARTLSKLEETAAEIKAKGGKVKSFQIDITKEDVVKNTIKKIIDEYGKIDILVNNSAATSPSDVNLVDMTLDNWNDTIVTNLTGTMLITREAIKYMIPRKSGNIINISSIAGVVGNPGRIAYTTSKFGIIGFTETLAIEVGKYNIHVNAISPAATDSSRFRNITRQRAERLGMSYDSFMQRILDMNSLGRVADVSEIGSVAVFLASDTASAITGQNLIVSCGYHMLQPSEIH